MQIQFNTNLDNAKFKTATALYLARKQYRKYTVFFVFDLEH